MPAAILVYEQHYAWRFPTANGWQINKKGIILKHAWLIIAHNEFGILQRLVSALDAPECDIYIHFDRKVRVLPTIQTVHSRLNILNKRIDVRWGSASQIRCEMALLEEASGNGPYDYYHIISGTTLPLKPLKRIEGFFEDNKGNCIVSNLCKDEPIQEVLKMRRYNLFLRHYTSSNLIIKTASQLLWKSSIAIQRILGIETNRGKSFYKASNWMSLTDKAVQYLLSHKKEIFKTYRYSLCGDEYFVPSELMDSHLAATLVDKKEYLFHSIGRSNAKVFSLKDLTELQSSGYLFARKFSES